MAKQVINIGSALNDGSGDSLRSGAQKINNNFTELYTVLGGANGAPLEIVSKISAGSGIEVSSGYGEVLVSAKTASDIYAGVVKVGSGLNINEGVLSAPIYSLPTAGTGSAGVLGGIKVGQNLAITNQGVLSAVLPAPYVLPKATLNSIGGVRSDETTTTVNANGTLSVLTPYPLTTPPTTSTGAEGDVTGMLAFDEYYIYYCTADWDGESDIWKRTQHGTGTW
jgi:formylmethanofuran dehydrogenase subunit D